MVYHGYIMVYGSSVIVFLPGSSFVHIATTVDRSCATERAAA